MSKSGIILKKELFRVFGDRKMLFSLFILPAIIVIAIYSLMGKMIGNMQSDIEQHISTVTVVNATEDLKQIISTVGYDKMADIEWVDEASFRANEESTRDAVLKGETDLVIYLEKDFAKYANEYKSAGDKIPEMKLYYNSTENYSSQAYSVFSNMVQKAYEETLLAQRFGNMDLLNVFTSETEVICKEDKANGEFMSMMLPYMIVMLLFAGVMSVGVDSLAGEKERGTLASMLVSPVSRRDIAIGKLVSLAVLSGLSSLVYSVSMIVAMSIMGSTSAEMTEMGFGSINFSPIQIVELILIMLGLVYMYVGVVGLLAIVAKDTKVASTYISPIYIVVILCGMMTMFSSGKEVPFYRYLIPVYGNAMAIKDVCGNELSLINFAGSFGMTVLIGAILTFAITKAFNSEKIMFNA